MLKRLFRRPVQLERATERCGDCTLSACASGCRAAVLHVGCGSSEATRLRNLGLFEGACITVVDSRNGLLLEVKGARLALGASLASTIRVLPLGS